MIDSKTKRAFIFPGQGSQFVGMGKDLYEAFPEVREIYEEAEQLLEFPIKELSFNGPEDELKKTRFTQPALFVHSMAVNTLLNKNNLKPDAVAGHSLGEYSALVAAGALSFADGLKLVKLRGELMQQSGDKNPGTMAAIIGLDEEKVREICEQASAVGIVKPANYNSPGQIVISGSIEGVHKAMELAKENKARMATELVVSGAFHSPLMAHALEGLAEALKKADLQSPQVPIYSNVEAKPVVNPESIRELLEEQLLSPVLWQDSMKNMAADGITGFYEVGPSKVLCGLNKRIQRDISCIPMGSLEDLKSLNQETI